MLDSGFIINYSHGWNYIRLIITAEKAGISLGGFRSNKLEDYERLRNSRLPITDDFITPYTEFTHNNPKLIEFLSKYERFVVLAIPNTEKLPRKPKKGIKSFKEAERFLRSVIKPRNENLYSVFLTDQPYSDYSGIIISKDDSVLVEISRAGLDKLSHGEFKKWHWHGTYDYNFFDNFNCGFKSMLYYAKNPRHRELMWRALQYLRRDSPENVNADAFHEIDFIQGYFEFIVTKDNEIKFLDYKVNEAYLR